MVLEDFRIRRRPVLDCLVGAHGDIDQPERELGGLADDVLEMRRILQSRHLDQNTVDAFALNARLDRAELVHPALHDLDRLVDRLADALGDRRRGQREADQAAAEIGDIDRALAAAAEHATDRLGKFPQLRQRDLRVGAFANADLDAVAAGDEPGIADPRLAQHAPHVIEQRLDFFFPHGVGIDLEQEVRTALKIQPQHDMALRPGRPALHHAVGEEIGDGEQADDDRRDQDRDRLPAGEKQHENPCPSQRPPAAISRTPRPSPVPPWHGLRTPSNAFAARGRRPRSRPRSDRRPRPW